MNFHYDIIKSPMGPITVACGDDLGVRRVFFGEPSQSAETVRTETWVHSPARARVAADQIRAYLAGKPASHPPVLAPVGTPYQLKVWAALKAIPFGESRTYLQIAQAVDSAPRAVGGAIGANPIAILIPCHRVVATDGSLAGFAWGVDRKIWLRRLEGLPEIAPKDSGQLQFP